MSDNSKLNKQSSALAEEAESRAISRQHNIVGSQAASTSQAGLKEGDDHKGKLAVDPASDLK